MKKIFSSSLLLILLFSLNSYGQSNSWMTYTSKEGHYSINFPAAPEESVQYDSSTGNIMKINFASYTPDDNTVMMAGWIDFTNNYDDTKTMQQMLESSRDGATGSMKATDVKTITTNLKGDPYIEFTFSTSDFTGKDRIYIINEIQYSLITIFSTSKGLTADADKFIRSFKHLSE